MTDLTGRLAVVTGASRGIGYHTALELGRAGAHVIAVARTVGGLEELDDEIKAAGASATLVPMDLADMEAIDRLGGAIFERWGKLDILVANAGILGVISPVGHIEAKVFDRVMTINVAATWRMIRSLEPLLLKSDAGRALFITSGSAWKCRAYWGPYAVSKAALDTLARTWAAEAATTPLKVMLVSPGPMRTRMRATAMPGEDAAPPPPPPPQPPPPRGQGGPPRGGARCAPACAPRPCPARMPPPSPPPTNSPRTSCAWPPPTGRRQARFSTSARWRCRSTSRRSDGGAVPHSAPLSRKRERGTSTASFSVRVEPGTTVPELSATPKPPSPVRERVRVRAYPLRPYFFLS